VVDLPEQLFLASEQNKEDAVDAGEESLGDFFSACFGD
jgi:hypothetical protein